MKRSSIAALTAFASILLLTAPSFAGNTSPYRTVAGNTSSIVPGSALPLSLRPSTNVLDKSVYRTVAGNTSSIVPGSVLPLWLRPSTNVLDKSVRTQAGSHFQSISQLQDAQKAAQEAAQK